MDWSQRQGTRSDVSFQSQPHRLKLRLACRSQGRRIKRKSVNREGPSFSRYGSYSKFPNLVVTLGRGKGTVPFGGERRFLVKVKESVGTEYTQLSVEIPTSEIHLGSTLQHKIRERVSLLLLVRDVHVFQSI